MSWQFGNNLTSPQSTTGNFSFSSSQQDQSNHFGKTTELLPHNQRRQQHHPELGHTSPNSNDDLNSCQPRSTFGKVDHLDLYGAQTEDLNQTRQFSDQGFFQELLSSRSSGIMNQRLNQAPSSSTTHGLQPAPMTASSSNSGLNSDVMLAATLQPGNSSILGATSSSLVDSLLQNHDNAPFQWSSYPMYMQLGSEATYSSNESSATIFNDRRMFASSISNDKLLVSDQPGMGETLVDEFNQQNVADENAIYQTDKQDNVIDYGFAGNRAVGSAAVAGSSGAVSVPARSYSSILNSQESTWASRPAMLTSRQLLATMEPAFSAATANRAPNEIDAVQKRQDKSDLGATYARQSNQRQASLNEAPSCSQQKASSSQTAQLSRSVSTEKSQASGSGNRRRGKLPFFTNSSSTTPGDRRASLKADLYGPSVSSSDESERFSRKVFVGGLPPDIDEEEIKASFRKFGLLVVDWPHKAESRSYFPPKGYAFLLFHEESSVQALIDACIRDNDKLYLCVSSPTIKDKPVQIRPWRLCDADYVLDSTMTLDPRKTVFVGGVPRPLKASELANIMNTLYGGVTYAGIDTDPELRYPKGAGRVAFSNHRSYIAAISARFVHLNHSDIDKRVEIKPYVLDDQFCDECQGGGCSNKFAPFFCSNITCLRYYCESCWTLVHSQSGKEFHKPLTKEGGDRPRGLSARWS